MVSDSYKLENVDSEEIEDLLVQIERSFDIKFKSADFEDVKTFGELCDVIMDKITLSEAIVNDCTTQQAFYKLRNGIGSVTNTDTASIKIDTPLLGLFGTKKRRKQILLLEKKLGFQLRLLSTKMYVLTILSILFIASCIEIYFRWRLGIASLALTLTGFYLANKFAAEIQPMTVGQLATKISRENYIQVRRDPSTVNRKEVLKKIQQWFSDHLALPHSELAYDASLGW